MEYNMLSNEIFMEYVWNIQVYGIYLAYAWYMTTSILSIIHIICQYIYIYGIYLAYAWHIPNRSIYLTYSWYTTSTKFWGSSRYPICMAYTYLMKVYVILTMLFRKVSASDWSLIPCEHFTLRVSVSHLRCAQLEFQLFHNCYFTLNPAWVEIPACCIRKFQSNPFPFFQHCLDDWIYPGCQFLGLYYLCWFQFC